MNAASRGIERKRPAQGAVRLLPQSPGARKVLVEERRNPERMVRKAGLRDDPVDPGLAGKVRHVELACADRFHVGQRRPDEVLDTGILGGAHRDRGLLELVGAWFPEIGHQENAVRPFKCGFEGFRPVQIRFYDFVAQLAMLVRVAAQSAYFELAASLEGTHHCASLLPGCADYGDQSFTVA